MCFFVLRKYCQPAFAFEHSRDAAELFLLAIRQKIDYGARLRCRPLKRARAKFEMPLHGISPEIRCDPSSFSIGKFSGLIYGIAAITP
jgi:hypothetical protein